MAVDNNQKLLIGLAVVAVALYFVNQKTDPKTAERRDDLARKIKKQPKTEAGATPSQQLYVYLTDSAGEYQRFRVKWQQWWVDIQITGGLAFPLPDGTPARAERLRDSAEDIRNTIRRLAGAAQQRTRESEDAQDFCERARSSVTYLLDQNGKKRNEMQDAQRITQVLKIMNIKIEQHEGGTTISNEWNSTKELHMQVGGGTKRPAEGFNQSPAPSIERGPPTAAKAQQIGAPTVTMVRDALPRITQVDLTGDDTNDDGAALVANAQPGNRPPPSVPLPASPKARVEVVPLDEYAPNEGPGAVADFVSVDRTEKTVPQTPPPKTAEQNAGKPSLKRAREEGVNFNQGGGTGESKQTAKKKRGAESGKPPSEMNSARRDGTKTFVGTKEGDLTNINGIFAEKLNDLKMGFLGAIDVGSVKTAGLAFWAMYSFVPLGDEETGYYTNLTTGKDGALEKGPNTMFQRIWNKNRSGGAIPAQMKEVAKTVQASPEYQHWRLVLRTEVMPKLNRLQEKQGMSKSVQPRSFYEKL